MSDHKSYAQRVLDLRLSAEPVSHIDQQHRLLGHLHACDAAYLVARKADAEIAALRKRVEELEAVLREGASTYRPVETVRCRGDKCREPWCESCNGEDDAQRAVEEARVWGERVRALLTPSDEKEVSDD